jgi:hypothetical protein
MFLRTSPRRPRRFAQRSSKSAQRVRPSVQELEPRNQPAGLGLLGPLLHADSLTPAVAAMSATLSDLTSLARTHAAGVADHNSINASSPVSGTSGGIFLELSTSSERIDIPSMESFSVTIEVVAAPVIEVITVTTPVPSIRAEVTADALVVELPATPHPTPARTPSQTPVESPTSVETSDALARPAVDQPTQVGPTAVPTSAVPTSAVTTAAVGTAVRETGTTIAGVAGGGAIPFLIAPAPPVLSGGGSSGGGVAVVATPVVLPAGAAVSPTGISPTGTVTGGDATPANGQQPMVPGPNTGRADEPSAAAAKGDEAPAIGARLESFLAALAAAAYSFWHWRRRAAPPVATRDGWHLARRATRGTI